MPGKVNPTQCEAMVMVCIQVVRSDTVVGIAGTQGNFELNAMRPIVMNDVLHSGLILRDASTKLRQYCIDGVELNTDRLPSIYRLLADARHCTDPRHRL
jgi:fumarate hydratase class II